MTKIGLEKYIKMICFSKYEKKIPFKRGQANFSKKTLKIMASISMNYILTQHFAIYSTDKFLHDTV